MEIAGRIALVTGAASGIGLAVSRDLARRGCKKVAIIDRNDEVCKVAAEENTRLSEQVFVPFVGDVTNPEFRSGVFETLASSVGPVNICVPSAGITQDALAVKMDRQTGRAAIYPLDTFRLVAEVDLIAPVYWAIEMIAHIAEDRHRRGLGRWVPSEEIGGTVIFIGSVSSQGNRGQIAYAAAKAGLVGAAATIAKEAIYYGVRACVIHPGFSDTPMVRAMGDEYVENHVLPRTQLGRLIRPEEIADAVCFMISNSAASREMWMDAGWHPSST